VVGALGLARDDGETPVAAERDLLAQTMLAQAALALERQQLAATAADVERLRERDRLRDALLSSVGHDLRTPLTAILAASAELRREGASDPAVVATLEFEAQRLDRYIANLLDMARLEAGALRLRTEPVDLTDAVAATLGDLRRQLSNSQTSVTLPADLPLVRADPHLLHHCLINLLDNAARHGQGRPIAIVGERVPGGVDLRVIDEGPGLPDGSEADVFGTFVRLEGSDRAGGTGLGLAIVKGFCDAMEVGVTAGNRGDRSGAVFTLRFSEALLVDLAPEATE
jgi:two-component system sensor histidine kinase KdpD